MTGNPTRSSHRRKKLGLVAGLLSLVAIATGFAIGIVQIQQTVTSYVAGESAWSRGQTTTIHYLSRYTETGNPTDLATARRWLDIPLGDLAAREAMDLPEPDLEAAEDGFQRGYNHPDDIPGLIWLYRYFSGYPPFRKALDEWRAADRGLRELDAIADRLATEWQHPQPDQQRLASMRERLSLLNEDLGTKATRFRIAMTQASHSLANLLTLASMLFVVGLSLAAWLLGARLVRLLRRSEHRFRAIFEQSSVGILQVARNGVLLDANSASCGILGYSRERLLACRLEQLFPGQRDDPDSPPLTASHHADAQVRELRALKGNGETIWARLTMTEVVDHNGDGPYAIVMLEDISESYRLSNELSYQASHDALTDLLNRRAFEHRLASTLGRARSEHTQHVLCFVDLDRFKAVNDTSGHGAGDQLLRQLAKLIRSGVRDGDVVARLGGDEFGLILENCDLPTARPLAEKLRKSIEQFTFTWEGRQHRIGASVGLAAIDRHAPDISALMRAADIACYRAKRQGRNQVCEAGDQSAQALGQPASPDWRLILETALTEGQFRLYGQEIIDTTENDPHRRLEVLLRLAQQDGSLCLPGQFLEPAFQLGLGPALDRWVVEQTLSLLQARQVPEPQPPTICHLNLSAASVIDPNFINVVEERLQPHPSLASQLCFEISEDTLVHNLTDAQALIKRLARLGCHLLVDHFGASLNAFSYLKGVPVEAVKIDQAFVTQAASDQTELAKVRAIHDICQSMGIQSMALCVESAETERLLRNLGIHYLQGFLLMAPCPLESLLSTNGRADVPSG